MAVAGEVAGVLWSFTDLEMASTDLNKRVSYQIFHCNDCMYSTLVQSVFMLTTLCTITRYFVYNYSVVATGFAMNVNLCSIVYSVLHGVLIITSCRGSTHLNLSSLTKTPSFPWGDIYQLKIISVRQENKHHFEEMRYIHKAINNTDNVKVLSLLDHWFHAL